VIRRRLQRDGDGSCSGVGDKILFTGSEEKITSARSHLVLPPITQEKLPGIKKATRRSSRIAARTCQRRRLCDDGSEAAEPRIYGGRVYSWGVRIEPRNLRREPGDHKKEEGAARGRRTGEKGVQGLFVWAVAGWLCRESCCAEKAAV
jgi:hypothetical protein